MNYDGHIVMKVNLKTGEHEPLYVFELLSEAVHYVEAMNERKFTLAMPSDITDSNDFRLADAGGLTSNYVGVYYVKNVPLAGKDTVG